MPSKLQKLQTMLSAILRSSDADAKRAVSFIIQTAYRTLRRKPKQKIAVKDIED